VHWCYLTQGLQFRGGKTTKGGMTKGGQVTTVSRGDVPPYLPPVKHGSFLYFILLVCSLYIGCIVNLVEIYSHFSFPPVAPDPARPPASTHCGASTPSSLPLWYFVLDRGKTCHCSCWWGGLNGCGVVWVQVCVVWENLPGCGPMMNPSSS